MVDKFLDLRKYKLKGNVLDIGYRDYGIGYNLCKRDHSDMNVEYFNGSCKEIEEKKYDICVLYFSFKNLWLDFMKEQLICFIYNVLDENGELYLWDVDKGPREVFNYNIKVQISEENTKIIKIRDFNFLNDNSKEKIIKLLAPKFDIIDFDYNDDIFYIRAKKKGC
ncbi:class I SAM-dependent methyltransferase [Haloimpatiens sp. FM7315]|uniref:class I SAM-dependent methyltransferase n=1 Tax=Haloimpatiens sp. FM7315 TaxID=3298609 RepID=UPI00370C13F8